MNSYKIHAAIEAYPGLLIDEFLLRKHLYQYISYQNRIFNDPLAFIKNLRICDKIAIIPEGENDHILLKYSM